MAHVKDMALSRAEFSRSLAVLMKGRKYTETATLVTFGPATRQVRISLKELPPRVLSALIKLERFEVTLDFKGYTDEEEMAFVAEFDRVFQRGGG